MKWLISTFGGGSLPWIALVLLVGFGASVTGAYFYGLSHGKRLERGAWQEKQAEALIARQEAERRLLAREQARRDAIDKADKLATENIDLQRRLDEARQEDLRNAIARQVDADRDGRGLFCLDPGLDRLLREQEGIADRYPPAGETASPSPCDPRVPTVPDPAGAGEGGAGAVERSGAD